MSVYEEIVRELADVDPYESGSGRCQECWATLSQDHSPTRLWLRARRAVDLEGGGEMHAMYDQEKGVFPCCGKSYGAVQVSDRMTLDPNASPVTCKGATAEVKA